jgi:myo-inositol catabolism protein IolS
MPIADDGGIMRYRKLGSSGLTVSLLSFGAWPIGDPTYWGAEAQADCEAAVRAAIDAGITLFDTAELYGGGHSEEVLGRALGRQREQVLIASKVLPAHCAPAELRRACEASLRRLGTDRIDLYQIHWPFRHVPFAAAQEAMQRLREEGKIRAIGVSNFGPKDLDVWMRAGGCVSNQLGYNLVFRAIEYEIIPACLRHAVGILAYMPLLQGILTYRWQRAEDVPPPRRRTRHFSSERPGTGHGEPGCETLLFETLARLNEAAAELGQPLVNVALAWLIAQPGVSSVIIGARNAAQLRGNVSAADLVLGEETLRRLDEISRPLKDHLGPNADMWLGRADSRIQ